jgi:aquaporin Z
MNPARSLAPALVGLDMHNLWIYLAGPLSGAFLAVSLSDLIHGPPVPPQDPA